MKKTQMILASALAATASLHAQTPGILGEKSAAFQYFVSNDKTPQTLMFSVANGGGKPVSGKPLAATEIRRTLQVLADGTRIEKTDTNKYFRDGEGRTRVERPDGGGVSISDPTKGFAELRGSEMTGQKVMVRKGTVSITTSSSSTGTSTLSGVDVGKLKAEAESRATALLGDGPATAVFSGSPSTGWSTARVAAEAGATEDLGVQLINGIAAKGTRTTLTIPVGQIGNDREIKVVSERWYSEDLQMLVKSSNKDPRFGETYYELSNVLQGPQDSALFQVPADIHGK